MQRHIKQRSGNNNNNNNNNNSNNNNRLYFGLITIENYAKMKFVFGGNMIQ